jgi:TatD DNase family protein
MSGQSTISGVDFHCHLDLYPDHAAAIEEAEAACIYTLAVTTTPKAWPRNRQLTEGKRYVRAALGLHPQLVAERPDDLVLWQRYLPETRYVGEVGLDAGPRFYRSLPAQTAAFRTVLGCCAAAGDKILTVHSVRAASAVLDLIEANLPATRGAVVLHWFTGSPSEARRAASLGCYFSVNSTMGETERGRTLLATLPMDRVLTETDGPFTMVDGRPALPSDVGAAVKIIAHVKGISGQTATMAIRHNLKRLLSPQFPQH